MEIERIKYIKECLDRIIGYCGLGEYKFAEELAVETKRAVVAILMNDTERSEEPKPKRRRTFFEWFNDTFDPGEHTGGGYCD